MPFTTLDSTTLTTHPCGYLPDCTSTSISYAQNRIYDSQLGEGYVAHTTVICGWFHPRPSSMYSGTSTFRSSHSLGGFG